MTITMMTAHFPALLAAGTFATPALDDYLRILPELVLSIFGMIVMVIDPLLDPERNQKPLGTIALIGAIAALGSAFIMAGHPGTAFSGEVQVDSFSIFFHVLIIAIAAVVILSSYEYMAVQRIRAGEYSSRSKFRRSPPTCLPDSAAATPPAANRRSNIFCSGRLPRHFFFTAWP